MASELGKAPFLKRLTPREMDRVLALADRRRYAAGTVIVQAGFELHSLYVIESGRVKVSVPVESAKGTDESEEVLVSLGPGDCFGEFAYADRKPTSAAITAEEETSAWELPHVALDALLESEPAIANKLLRGLLELVVGRLRSTDAELALARYILRYV